MAENKKSFIAYSDWHEMFQTLPDDVAGKLIKHIFSYVNDESFLVSEDIESLYLDIINQIEFEWSKYNPNTGKYHWNYKGGVTDKNKSIRNSNKYKYWRNKVFKRDDYTCQVCFSKGVELNAHHIKGFAEFPKLRLRIDNGLTLCKSCHIKEHKK